MLRRASILVCLAFGIVVACPHVGLAQTTYRLHREASTTPNLLQLKTAVPDAAILALQSANLKGVGAGGQVIKEFDTQAGVPGLAGAIPSGATVTFQFYMRVTASVGTAQPRAFVALNNTNGTALCTAIGNTALTTTLTTPVTISCTLPQNVTMTATDRFYLWTGVNLTGVSHTSFNAELDIEGTPGGNYDSWVTIPNPMPPPTTTSLTPSSAGVGQTVTIAGTNFGATQGSSVVQFFNGCAAGTATTWSATSITIPVPSCAATGNVTVTVAGQVSNGQSFTLLPTPSITTLSPVAGPVGTSVTLTGTNFGASQGSSTVTFNGTSATTVTGWNATQITAQVPVGATTGPVVVTVNGVPSAGVLFTVPPILTSLTPAAAHLTDPVTIAGSNFLGTQGTSTVTFNGTLGTPTAWNATSITVPVPTGATTGNVVVTVNGQASNGLRLTVIPPPTLTAATPSSTTVGDTVWIAGTNFGASQGTNTIKFNGTTATPTSWSDNRILTPVPANATTGNVIVTVSNQASNGLPFTVVAAGTLSGTITRATGGTAIAGATVQLVQTGIVKAAATTSTAGAYSMTPIVPGTYDVRVLATGFSTELRQGQVINAGATTTLNVALLAPGSIGGQVTQSDGVTPLVGAAVTVYSGPVPKGTASTNSTGAYTVGGLHPGAFTVQAAYAGYATREQSATVTENATTTSNFALQGAPGNPVLYAYDELNRLAQVTDPSGNSAIYRYDAVGNITAIERPGSTTMSISGFAPLSGPVGTVVTIYGAGFSTTPASNQVTFNGTPATVTAATATQLTVAVPAGATTGQIAVSWPPRSANTGSTVFTVLVVPAVPTITSATPSVALSGATLQVNGTGFDLTLANDRLTLNQVLAPPTAGTALQLTTTIPPIATPGRVSLTTPAGTATGPDVFPVPPGYTVAAIEATARTTIGVTQSVTINGATNVGLVVFDGTAGQRVSVILGGAGMYGGNATLYGPNWQVLGSAVADHSNLFINAVVLPRTATYTVLAVPFGTPPFTPTVTVNNVAPDVTGTLPTDGTPFNIVTTTPGQGAHLTLNGTAGQKASVLFTSVPFWSRFTILRPDGVTQLLAPQNVLSNGTFIDAGVLPDTGAYTVVMDNTLSAFGTITLQAYEFSDLTATIPTDGSTQSFTVSIPGQNLRLSFTSIAGHRYSAQIGGGNFFSRSTIFDVDGTTVLTSAYGAPQTLVGPVTIANPGTHVLYVDPDGSSTGSVTVALFDMPADITGTIAPDTSVTPSITTPGQKAVYTINATAGQRLSLSIGAGPNGSVEVLNADGSTLVSGQMSALGFFIEPWIFAAGQQLRVDPSGVNTGSVTLTLHSVNPDTTGSITINGSGVVVSLPTAGQNGTLTFTGTAGQSVTVHGKLSSIPAVTVKLLSVDGTTVLVQNSFNSASFDLQAVTLPTTTPPGVYTIVIDPTGDATGQVMMTVTSP